MINQEKWKAMQEGKIAQGKLAHHQSLAYDQTLWQIFLNSFPFWAIKSVTGVPSQALQIIFEMQSQGKELQRNYVFGHQLLYPKFVRVVEALLVEYIVTMPKKN